MKKFMYIAAALLVLVGCNKKENVIENAPQNLVTITGGIDFSAQDGPNKVAAKEGWENVASGNQVEFMWEEGDKIAVTDFTEVKQFTVTSISEDKQTATFTGEPLSGGMEYYLVFYPYEYGEAMINEQDGSFFASQPYSEKLRPYIMGSSEQDGTFTMSIFSSVMDLSLTGSDKLGKMVYHIDKDQNDQPYDVTLSFGDGLQLTNQVQHVTFTPYFSDPNGFKLSFYDTNNQLIMEKKSEKNIDNVDKIFSFPTLEVKDPYNGHAYVDLGLSVKWATMNVGATTPEGYGDYFAWGETETKTSYYNNYTYTDNPTTLPLDHDAAAANWKGAWRMPTKAEFDELLDGNKCKKEWTTQNNVNGYKFTSLVSGYEDNSIFLPAAGYRERKLNSAGSKGYYWSSLLDGSSSDRAEHLYFENGFVGYDLGNRDRGYSVRPVCK